MSLGPSKVGTQTTTTDNTPWNSNYLTGLYDAGNYAYLNDKTLYQDPSVQDTYNKYLYSGDTIDKTVRPQSYGAWNNAVTGGLGVTNSPVYWDEYNLGKGQTNTQLGLDTTADRLNAIGTDAPAAANNYAGHLSGLAGDATSTARPYQSALSSIGTGALNSGNAYAGSLAGLGGSAPAAVSPYQSALSNTGNSAQNSGNAYAGYLGNLGGSAPNATNDYQRPLRDTANGAYLNANPYLDQTYNSAAGAVTRAYQTATAPQADTVFERAGRYGSGAMANARHQNQLDLGTSLDNLATDIYGKNYANERSYQNAAASAGGNLALGGIDSGTKAYSAAGETANRGYNSGLVASNYAGNLGLGGIDAGLKGYGAAAQAANQGYNTAAQTNTDAGKLGLSSLDTGLRGYDSAGKLALSGYDTGVNALRGSAAADLGNLASQYQGLSGLQSGYEAGNKNLLTGLGLTGDVLKAQTYGLDTSLTGAQGLQTYGQAATDAPWTALNRYSTLLGNPIAGSSETSKPIYGPNGLTSAIGTGSSLLNLGNSLNTATGSGGFLSGLGSALLK